MRWLSWLGRRPGRATAETTTAAFEIVDLDDDEDTTCPLCGEESPGDEVEIPDGNAPLVIDAGQGLVLYGWPTMDASAVLPLEATIKTGDS